MAITALKPVSNGAKETLELSEPYIVELTIEGTAALLFHRWNVESVEAKSKAAKNSAAKKRRGSAWRSEVRFDVARSGWTRFAMAGLGVMRSD